MTAKAVISQDARRPPGSVSNAAREPLYLCMNTRPRTTSHNRLGNCLLPTCRRPAKELNRQASTPREVPILRRHLTQMHLTMHGQRHRSPKSVSCAKFLIDNFKIYLSF